MGEGVVPSWLSPRRPAVDPVDVRINRIEPKAQLGRKETQRLYRLRHRAELREKSRDRYARWRADHPINVKASQDRYYEKHKEARLAKARAWKAIRRSKLAALGVPIRQGLSLRLPAEVAA
jgi:hypothetical protein